jgi:hypothetical protein
MTADSDGWTSETGPCVRASVSFEQADYRELTTIARSKRVSVAWVVREAVRSYLAARSPLFPPHSGSRGAG